MLGGARVTASWYGVSLWSDENILKLDHDCATLEYVETTELCTLNE